MIYNPDYLPHPQVFYTPQALKCIHIVDQSHPVVCLQLYIKTGSASESPAHSGYSHFIEHLVFKSTRLYPQNSISARAQALGGVLNAFTDFDCTCFYLILPREAMHEGLVILQQLACAADFTPADVESEKEVILEEIKQYQNDPESDFLDFIQHKYFKHSPLKHPVLGYPASLQAATHSSLSAYYHKHYTADNAFLVISGDYEPERLPDEVNQVFDLWHGCSSNTQSPPSLEPELRPSRRISRATNSDTDLLAFSLPELTEAHPMSDALLAAMRWLAIGKSSRLYKRLVEEEHLCSGVRVNSLSGVLSGISVIFAYPLSDEHHQRIEEIFIAELAALLEHGVPEPQLDEIKTDLIHNWLYSFDGVENLANLCAAEEFIGNVMRLTRYGEIVAAITPKEILAAVRQYWQMPQVSIFSQHESSTDQEHKLNLHSPTEIVPPFSSPLSLIHIEPLSSHLTPIPAIEQIAEHHFRFILPSGLQVLHNQLPGKTTSGFSLSTALSQLYETQDLRGVNFFTSAMMLYRSKHFDHQELMRYSRAYGLNIRAIHHLDSTTFRGKCMSDSLEQALALLGELMFNPRFDPSYLKLLKSTAIDSIYRDKANPVNYAYQKWFDLLTGKKGNLSRTTGSIGDIRKLSLAHLEGWRAAQSLNRDYHLAVVSPHSPEQLYASAEKYLGANDQAAPMAAYAPDYLPSNVKTKKEYRKSEQAIIHLGSWAAPAHDHDANAAFYVLAQIIGGDGSSRLYDIIREKHSLAYQTGFDFTSLADLGIWNAYAYCDHECYRMCLDAMLDIFSDIHTHGVNPQEVASAISYLLGMNRIDLESVSYRASSMSCLAALGYPPEHFLTREQRLQSVTLEQVNSVARQWLNPANIYTHILL